MLELGVEHRHYRPLGLAVEVVVAQHGAVGKGRLKVGVTDDYAQGVGHVGNGLQLAHRRLRRPAVVAEHDARCLAELIAVAQEGGEVEHVAARYVFVVVEQVDRLRHLGHERYTGVEVAFLAHVAVAEAYVLVHVVVAEAIRQLWVEYEFLGDERVAFPSVRECDGVVVGHLVGIVPAVAEAVGEGEEVALGGVAEWLGPGQARCHAVAPGVVVGKLVVEVDRVVEQEEFVERICLGILAHVAQLVLSPD